MAKKKHNFRFKDQLFRKENFNKYSITAFLFIVWIGFFDNYNLSVQYQLKNKVERLKTNKITFQDKLAEAIQEKKELDNNSERYAREKFLMHKENEEIIIIERK